MKEEFEHEVYSKNVIEFVTVANEFCTYLETCNKNEAKQFAEKAQKLLPLLYLKASLLPQVDTMLEENLEKFVNEADWEYIRSMIQAKLGANDEYLEVFDKQMQESDEPLYQSISECFADIYQDLKDFLSSYRIGSLEIMNDALWELNNNFGLYWGQNTVNTLRAIHKLLFGETEWEIEPLTRDQKQADLSNSIFSQRQEQWKEDNID